jgi:hypothetical protein
MRYVSPFQELGIEIDINLDKANLHLAKKRLLAELELSSDVTILRGSVEMTKNDVITQFDKLASLENWDFHRLIFADKGLLDFLQNKKWNGQFELLKLDKYNDDSFICFISPYFFECYKSLIIKNIAKGNSGILEKVLNISPRLLTGYDYETAWFLIELFLENWIETLKEIAENIKNGNNYNEEELIHFHRQSFMQCLNLLPNQFEKFRDNYAELIYAISQHFWNQEERHRAMEMVANARFLDVSFRVERLLDKRIAWFDGQMHEINNPPSEHATNWGMIAKVFMFILYIFVRWITCNHH